MSRYQSNQELRYPGKPRQFKSNIYPPIPRSVKDIYLVSNSGDRLDLLSHKYYGDQTLWWIIAVANDLGKHGMIVPPGRQLRIPTELSKIQSLYRELQGER
jgi:nucleoid-associated protein YgaU